MPVKLTIDGEQTVVDDGTSLLGAARQLGRRIPTLCHLDGVEPVGSCFLCVVSVDGKSGLVPSCVALAEDGMIVTTDSDEIRAARRMALELLLSDHLGDCEAPCTLACPAGLDIPGFLRHLAAGRPDAAARLIRQSIPLPGALGRICAAYCERACRRGRYDEPVSICILKRVVADRERAEGAYWLPEACEATGKSVAIVGAGPAGLSAAYRLRTLGHACTIYDAGAEPGGMLRYGVPDYELPQAALEHDVEAIRRMGVCLRQGVTVGASVALDDLRQEYDAVLIATGASLIPPKPWEGASLATPALEFLWRVATHQQEPLEGPVAVVGEGQEAVAAARCAARLADGVTLISASNRSRMMRRPGVEEASAEGVELITGVEVRRLARKDRGALECALRRDAEETRLEAAHVIAAPAREVDADALQSMGLAVEDGALLVDGIGRCRGTDDVFAAGEATAGAGVAIRAIASAMQAAASIDQFLRGERVVGERKLFSVRMGRLEPGVLEQLCNDYPDTPRARPAMFEADARVQGFEEVQAGLSAEAARGEAERCLHCDCRARDDCKLRNYATEYGADPRRFSGEARQFLRDSRHRALVYESGKCISCGLCVRISEQEDEQLGMAFQNRGFATRVGVPFDEPLGEGLTGAAQRCVEACPTGALAWKANVTASPRRPGGQRG